MIKESPGQLILTELLQSSRDLFEIACRYSDACRISTH